MRSKEKQGIQLQSFLMWALGHDILQLLMHLSLLTAKLLVGACRKQEKAASGFWYRTYMVSTVTGPCLCTFVNWLVSVVGAFWVEYYEDIEWISWKFGVDQESSSRRSVSALCLDRNWWSCYLICTPLQACVALELYKLDPKENIWLKRGTRLVVNVSNIVYLGQKMPHFFWYFSLISYMLCWFIILYTLSELQ